MLKSPFRSTLYRSAGRAVISLAVFLGTVQMLGAEFAQRQTASQGPRAVALLQLAPNGKAHLIPISIMINGKFYDAGVYKADPVPMALDPGTVYEAERTGTSLGLFTVSGALHGQRNNWVGEGTWQAAGSTSPSTAHKAESKPVEVEDKPPFLRRPGSEAPQPPSKPAETKPATPAPAPPSPPTAGASPASTPAPRQDTNHPRLRRGIPSEPAPEETGSKTAPAGAPAKNSGPALSSSLARTNIQIIPAVSDADGPEPRPYTYEMKPQEEQTFRKKILALAADELSKRARELDPELAPAPPSTTRRTKAATTSPQPTLENVNLRVFDLSTSNEPVLVLTATAHLPERAPKAGAGSPPAHDFYITLVAHSDLYGELRNLFAAVSDSNHQDVMPRMELIDAVDADGDGRGELLFRQIFDSGSAYAIYRVGADQLWPLFEGTPSGQ